MTDQPPRDEELVDSPDELIDGYTLDQLSEYLDEGRTPPDPGIDDSAECQHALASLERLRALSAEVLADDAAHLPTPEESWIQSIMRGISREVRAGRPVPIHHPDENTDLTITEGAVRALIRRAGDSVPGAVIGRTRFDGDIADPAAPVSVGITVTAVAHVPLRSLADRIRNVVRAALTAHTELNVAAIDITVTDIYSDTRNRTAAP